MFTSLRHFDGNDTFNFNSLFICKIDIMLCFTGVEPDSEPQGLQVPSLYHQTATLLVDLTNSLN